MRYPILTRDTAFRLSAGEPLKLADSHDLPDAQRGRYTYVDERDDVTPEMIDALHARMKAKQAREDARLYGFCFCIGLSGMALAAALLAWLSGDGWSAVGHGCVAGMCGVGSLFFTKES